MRACCSFVICFATLASCSSPITPPQDDDVPLVDDTPTETGSAEAEPGTRVPLQESPPDASPAAILDTARPDVVAIDALTPPVLVDVGPQGWHGVSCKPEDLLYYNQSACLGNLCLKYASTPPSYCACSFMPAITYASSYTSCPTANTLWACDKRGFATPPSGCTFTTEPVNADAVVVCCQPKTDAG